MKNKYRIKEFDPLHDIYLLQRHVFWFWWVTVSAGTKHDIEKFIVDKITFNNLLDDIANR
jgi:hypothetical protein|tara:strand:- start:32 stop:211 length:180 start_codon:yes stop_codon:yes gene_type:complete